MLYASVYNSGNVCNDVKLIAQNCARNVSPSDRMWRSKGFGTRGMKLSGGMDMDIREIVK
jgi:hypothetical protein